MVDQTHWKNNTHRNWWQDPGLRKNTAWVVLLYFGCFILGYDGTLITGLQAMPQWNRAFNNPAGARLGIITASLYLSAIPSSAVVPWVCDSYGRRASILIGSMGSIAGAIIACFSNNEAMFITGRVVIGFFSVFLSTGCTCLVNELVHPRLRGISGSLYISAYIVGMIISSWLTFGCLYWDSNWAWRIPVLFQAFGPFILVFSAIFGPESPRYLINKGRNEDALTMLAKFHANGVRDDELVQEEYKEIFAHIQRDREESVGNWRSLLATPGNRRRLMIVFIVDAGATLLGTNVIAAYLPPVLRSVGITNPVEISLVNGALSIFGLFVSIVGGLCVDRVGRRPLYLISTAGVLVTFAMLIGLAAGFAQKPDSTIGIAFVVIIFFCFGSYELGWLPLASLYLPEILPFSIRSKAISFGSLVSSVFLAVTGFVNPIGLEALQWKFYFVYLAIQVTYLFLIWWLFIETRGRTIEQVSVLFDEDREVHFRDREKQ